MDAHGIQSRRACRAFRGDAVFDAAGDTSVSDDDDEAKEAGHRENSKELTVSAVVPALNEAATVERVLARLATLEPKRAR